MKKIILHGPTIFTNNADDGIIESGAVLISNGLIEAIGEYHDITGGNPDAVEERLGDGLLTPGLINLHHHLYSTMARGWSPPGEPAENFPQILDRIWWKLDSALRLEDILYSALVGLCESALSGVTTVVDHHSSQNVSAGSLDMIAAAFDKVGLSGSICFEISDRGGADAFNSALNETMQALIKWPFGSNISRMTSMVGLHASMTLSDKSLKKIAEETKSQNAGYHFHLAEDNSDQDDSLEKYGMRVTERFAKFGLLNKKSLAIHGVHLENNEIDLLNDSGTNLVLCPRSNQNNAVGFSQWWNYEGLKIGFGTDGIGPDIINEARSALYISRHITGKPEFGFDLVRQMLLNNNPKIYEKISGIKTGIIAPGYPADLVLWRYNPPTPLSIENIWGHYLYGLSNFRAESVWADGRKILSDGVFVDFDYDEILYRSRALAKSLWERI
jgi:putative selenium metabolism protein SsnA